METVAVFAATLFLAVLLSEYAERSVLSTAVIFLVAGFLSGPDMLGLLAGPLDSRALEISLFGSGLK
jgi:Kef-type K+ transport system membrane component KefB